MYDGTVELVGTPATVELQVSDVVEMLVPGPQGPPGTTYNDGGTTGDGTADDYATLQVMLTLGQSPNLNPRKTYRCSRRLDVTVNGTGIEGNGARLILDADGFNNASASGPSRYGTNAVAIYAIGVERPFVRNLRIAPSVWTEDRYVAAIVFKNCIDSDVRGNEIWDFSKSTRIIGFEDCTGGWICFNVIRDCYTNSATDGQITGIVIDGDSGQFGASGIGSSGLHICDNHIMRLTVGPTFLAINGGRNYQTDAIHLASSGSTLGKARDLIVMRNVCEQVGEGIDTYCCDSLLSMNTFRDIYSHGIPLKHGAARNTISHNIFTRVGRAFIGVFPAITNNTEFVRNIVSVSRTSFVTTVVTAVPHQFSVGRKIKHSGVTDTSFNDSDFAVVTAILSAESYTVAQIGGDATSSGGRATSYIGVEENKFHGNRGYGLNADNDWISSSYAVFISTNTDPDYFQPCNNIFSDNYWDLGNTGDHGYFVTAGSTASGNASIDDVVTNYVVADYSYSDGLEVYQTKHPAEMTIYGRELSTLAAAHYLAGAESAVAWTNNVGGGTAVRTLDLTALTSQWITRFSVTASMRWTLPQLYPFDPAKKYKVTFRVRRNAGSTGNANLGLLCYKADRTTRVSTAGTDTYASAHYVCAQGLVQSGIGTDWTEYTGYVFGTSDTPSGAVGTLASPAQLHTNTRFMAPHVIFNNGGTHADDCQIDKDSVRIEIVQAATTAISGSRGGNAALASLLTLGAAAGLWVDNTTA